MFVYFYNYNPKTCFILCFKFIEKSCSQHSGQVKQPSISYEV